MVARRWMMMVVAVVPFVLASGCERGAPPAAGVETIDAVIGGERFRLELALDKPSRRQGLSDRDPLDADAGMLFVFPAPEKTAFVMRRCRFPIDLVQIGPGGRVDRVHRMAVEPYDRPERDLRRYSSDGRIQFAIEFADGTLDRLDLKPGQKIDLPFKALKRRAR